MKNIYYQVERLIKIFLFKIMEIVTTITAFIIDYFLNFEFE